MPVEILMKQYVDFNLETTEAYRLLHLTCFSIATTNKKTTEYRFYSLSRQTGTYFSTQNMSLRLKTVIWLTDRNILT